MIAKIGTMITADKGGVGEKWFLDRPTKTSFEIVDDKLTDNFKIFRRVDQLSIKLVCQETEDGVLVGDQLQQRLALDRPGLRPEGRFEAAIFETCFSRIHPISICEQFSGKDVCLHVKNLEWLEACDEQFKIVANNDDSVSTVKDKQKNNIFRLTSRILLLLSWSNQTIPTSKTISVLQIIFLASPIQKFNLY